MSIAPAVMTYDSLVLDLQNYAERSDDPFVEQIPSFIALAENRIASEAHGLGFLQVVTTTLNSATLPKPNRWRETKSFSITASGSIVFLQSRSYQYCRAFNPTNATGVPRYYSDEDYEHWFIAPVPAAVYPVEVQYHERPEPLSEDNQTSWTTQYAPQILLYATLLEAQPFLKLPERVQEFQAMYDRALIALLKEDERRLRPDAAAVRS